jgi:hypothetical protein
MKNTGWFTGIDGLHKKQEELFQNSFLVGQGNIAWPDGTVAVEWIVIVFVLGQAPSDKPRSVRRIGPIEGKGISTEDFINSLVPFVDAAKMDGTDLP